MTCERCGGELHVGDFPFCKGNTTDHARGVSTVIGDEVDFVQTNGLRHPRRFRSRLDHQRWLKENDYRVKDTQAGGQSAAIVDPQTLENGRYLVMHRQMIDAAEPPDPPMNIRWYKSDGSGYEDEA